MKLTELSYSKPQRGWDKMQDEMETRVLGLPKD